MSRRAIPARAAGVALAAGLAGHLAFAVSGQAAAAPTDRPAALPSPLPTSLCLPPAVVCEGPVVAPPAELAPSPTPVASPSPTRAAAPTSAPVAPSLPAWYAVPAAPPVAPAATPPVPAPAVPSTRAAPAPARGRPVATRVPDLAGVAGLGLGVLLAVPLLLSLLVSFAVPSGGRPMTRSRSWQLLAAAGCLTVAAVVAFVGWYRIAGEPLLNFQLPILASTGLAVLVLTVVAGSLLVADRLRAGDRRVEELEEAVRGLTVALEAYVEAPPRRSDEVVRA